MRFGVSDYIDDLVACRGRSLHIGPVSIPWPFPVASGLYSSAAMVLGRPVYGSGASRPIRALHYLLCKMSDVKWWFLYRLHPGHRYHMVNTGLGYGYHERDEQLLHSAIACLIGYVDDCERSGCHDPGDEARAILHWWRVTRPADRAQSAQWMTELYGGKIRIKSIPAPGQPNLVEIVFDPLSDGDDAKQKAMWALDEKMHNDEQDYLHRLINIRPAMWT